MDLHAWMSAELEADAPARLTEAGGRVEGQRQVPLAQVFVDLPAWVDRRPVDLLHELCAGGPRRHLLVGGPGSGKTTVATMVAQVLRAARLGRPHPEGFVRGPHPEGSSGSPSRIGSGTRSTTVTSASKSRSGTPESRVAVVELMERLEIVEVSDALPIRLSLPELATELGADDSRLVWRHLARRIEVTDAEDARQLARGAGAVYWILDGLDEVPPSAGRDRVVAAVRAEFRPGDSVLVCSRPQAGYRDALDDLDELTEIALAPLDLHQAVGYAGALLNAWGADPQSAQQLLAQPTLTELCRTPLHVALVAVLLAEGSVPNSRWGLYDHFFGVVFRRELPRLASAGVTPDDRHLLRVLHARAGLLLHAAAQRPERAASGLSRGELRAVVTEWLTAAGHPVDAARARADQLVNFSTERLVLLVQSAEGRYGFQIRSLQEFFAADGLLMDVDTPTLRTRVAAAAPSPHWEHVLRIAGSSLAVRATDVEGTIAVLAGVCRAIDAGEHGDDAKRCRIGAQLALVLLAEIQRYAVSPRLVTELWDVVWPAVTAGPVFRFSRPVPGFHAVRVAHVFASDAGGVASESPDPGVRERWLAHGEALLQRPSAIDRVRGRLLLDGAASDETALALSDRLPPRADEDEALHWVGRSRWRRSPVTRQRVDPSNEVVDLESDAFLGFQVVCLGAQLAVNGPGGEPDVWSKVAAFHEAPTPETLAGAVEAANDNVRENVRALAWPLAACLEWTPAGACAALAGAIRAGDLGGTEDWSAAEVRWRAGRRFSESDVTAWLQDPRPFSRDIGRAGIAVTALDLRLHVDTLGVLQQRLVAALRSGVAPFKASRALVRLARAVRPLPLAIAPGLPLTLAEVRGPHSAAWDPDLFRLGVLAPDLHGPDGSGWIELLDAWGRGDRPVVDLAVERFAPGLVGPLAQAHASASGSRWGLESLLLEIGLYAPGVALPEDLDLPLVGRTPRARAIRAALLLVTGRIDASEIADTVAALDWQDDIGPGSCRAIVAVMLARGGTDVLPTLRELVDTAPPDDMQAVDLAAGSLCDRIRSACTPFATASEWREHRLPEPPPRLPARPPRLLRIEALRGIRLFAETPKVDAPFAVPADPESGQWILLVGENGSGKTTLLRALALAVAPPAVASRLLDERVPLARNGDKGVAAFELDTGVASAEVVRKDRLESVEAGDGDTLDPRPWIVGYGVRRGNARGDKDREPVRGPTGELHTLFDQPATLTNAVDWLKELERQALREDQKRRGASDGPKRALWAAVDGALRRVLGVARIVPGDEHVFVEHPAFGRVRLDALSDGYLTTAGWVVDLIARWVDRQNDLDEPVGRDVLREMTGFVLIDEIDLHLHPLWQLRIVDDLRALFPRLSFVATTHSPLTLMGARPGEAYVMRWGDDRRVELVQRDVLPGHDADRVLFEQFAVESTLDAATRALLRQHRATMERGAPADDPERSRLEAALREVLGAAGDRVVAERDLASRGPRLRPDERHLMAPYLKPRE